MVVGELVLLFFFPFGKVVVCCCSVLGGGMSHCHACHKSCSGAAEQRV